MNENSHPGSGKIAVHGNGVGAPNSEMVEKRAREIALINERDPNDYTDADWDQARKELLGDETIPSADDTDEVVDGMSDRDSVPDESGHRVPRSGFDDDDSVGDILVSGGIEEAAHDQMVEAAREDKEEEG